YMLLYQGAEAFRLFTGHDMPVEDIRAKYFA
ncbi:MAG: quinate/shikimate dehydrogenase, partial [Blautia sp.]|nr:quinate/shikimate dehydrogenase [Blautia sp.]